MLFCHQNLKPATLCQKQVSLTVCIALTPINDLGLDKVDIKDLARVLDQNQSAGEGTDILDLRGDLPVLIIFHFVKKL